MVDIDSQVSKYIKYINFLMEEDSYKFKKKLKKIKSVECEVINDDDVDTSTKKIEYFS